MIDGEGNPVLLRGYNIGGWMNMENFITGYPGTESQQRRALLQALGPERYELFFRHFMSAFFDEDDARYIASLGMNSVRIPFNYRHFEDDDRPFELKESGFELLDRAVRICQHYGLYAILDFHAVPGAQNRHWHSDNPTHVPSFWIHRHFQDRVVRLWEVLADRYKGNPTVAGYNIMNEPADIDGDRIKPFYDRVVAAVRAVDPDHVIFLDGNRYGTDFSAFVGMPLYPNTVYAVHDYHPPGFVYGGPYPGVTRGTYVDRAYVENTFLRRTEFMRSTGTPIWVGEFGPVFTGDPERDQQRYQLLQDQLDIYQQAGAGWCLWAYKDLGAEGLVFAAPDSPWSVRIRSITAKKAKLGVDTWGSVDTGIRHIMAPIEETFSKEFPDFDPYPFGVADWLTVLVRGIVLAEPMVDDFRRCFADIADDETVIDLANSFCFENCIRRDRLADHIAASVQLETRSPLASD